MKIPSWRTKHTKRIPVAGMPSAKIRPPIKASMETRETHKLHRNYFVSHSDSMPRGYQLAPSRKQGTHDLLINSTNPFPRRRYLGNGKGPNVSRANRCVTF